MTARSSNARPMAGTGRSRTPVVVLAALLAVDAVLLAVHVASTRGRLDGIGPVSTAALSLHTDYGLAELWAYVLAAVGIGGLVFLWRRTGDPHIGAWSLTFATVMLDDVLRLHERGGEAVADVLDLPHVLGLRPYDLGQPFVWFALALPLLAVLAVTYRRASTPAREYARVLAILLLALAASGAGMDVLAMLVGQGRLQRLLMIAEDLGEVVVITVLAGFVVGTVRSSADATQWASTPTPRR